ncbi:Rad52/Rad22 family DNA repair protein [Streptomyces sp. NPDC020379]|uniref:Rad52/Rad22 family DNA repair protein n=1 Tax=Streptomyces sp. NPDC020379 TaxID=3365071 RepID=UPI0037A8FED3
MNAPTPRQPVRLSAAQYEKLCDALHPDRISQDGKGFHHVEAHDIEAVLSKVFGFGMWSTRILAEECVAEDQVRREDGTLGNWYVSYQVRMRLTAYDPHGAPLGPWEDGTVETAAQPQRGGAHELAYKSAISGALKRCARAMGNQFGLSLYRKAPKGRPALVAVSSTLNPPASDPVIRAVS